MVPKITNDGLGLQVLALDGEGLNFSKIVLGNGEAPLDYRVLKDLVNPLEELSIDDLDIEDTEAVITATFSNANTDDSFDWTEVGIFCTNPASTQQEPLDDILYAYGHCRLDDENIDDAAHIPAHGSEVFEILLKYRIFIGDLDDVTATIIDSQNYATKLELNQHIAEVNPHNLTAEDIGLGNVENKAFLDNEIGFQITGATSGQISPGMNIKEFFRKVYMAIENLTSHIANTVSHVSSSDRTSWNNKSDKGHKHSAADLTSGVLSASRGGTGVSNLDTLWTNLWKGRHCYIDKSKILYGKDNYGDVKLFSLDPQSQYIRVGDPDFNGKMIVDGPWGITLNGGEGSFQIMTSGVAYSPNGSNLGTSSYRFGTVYCTNVNNSSDLKTKENIKDIDSAADIIRGLKPIKYNRKGSERDAFGFGAQDVYELLKSLGFKNSEMYDAGKNSDNDSEDNSCLPDAAIEKTNDEELNWGLDYTQIIAPLVAFVQEQDKRISELEEKLNSQEV